MPSYTHTEVVAAPREVVFDVVADRLGYAKITPVGVKLLRPGSDGAQGVGAVHRIGAGPLGPKEEVVEVTRPERFVYKVIGGLPVRDHVGTVLLSDNGDGTTTLAYTMDSTSILPMPAAIYTRVLKAAILSLAKPIAKHAAQVAKQG